MTNVIDFIRSILPKLDGISDVVMVTGLSALDGLKEDIRNNKFPCIAVDEGGDGTLDISAGVCDKSFNTFFVLHQVAPSAKSVDKDIIYRQAKSTGKSILFEMLRASRDLDDPMYGFSATDISYTKIGSGFSCIGYAFNFILVRDV